MILAAGHLLSWNIEFTNDNGQALWRGCGLCILASVVVFASNALLHQYDAFGYGACSDLYDAVKLPLLIISAILYVTARLILIYLTIYSFSDLPAGVYDDIDWLQYIPFFH